MQQRASSLAFEPCAPAAPHSYRTAALQRGAMEQVTTFLTEHGLGSYAALFSELGYDDLALLPELDAEELSELFSLTDMKRGHAVKLKKRLAELFDRSGGQVSSTNLSRLQQELADQSERIRRLEEAISAPAETTSAAVTAVPEPAAAGALKPKKATKGLERGFFAAATPEPPPNPAAPSQPVPAPAPPPAAAAAAPAALAAPAAAPATEASRKAIVPLDEEMKVDVPDEFQCVITKEMFREPVITSDGHTYERSAIRQWLEAHDTSPRTGNVLPDRVLRPNHVLRSQIVEFRERHGLASLPVWEPDPQETVQTPPSPAHPMHFAGQPAHGGGGQPVMLHPQQMVQILQQVLVECPGVVGQLAAIGIPGATSDPQTAIAHICQNP